MDRIFEFWRAQSLVVMNLKSEHLWLTPQAENLSLAAANQLCRQMATFAK